MLCLIRAAGLIAALAIVEPALAQHSKPISRMHGNSVEERGLQPGFVKSCGANFVCYTGIPIGCPPYLRPYQNVPEHQCYCLRDGCPPAASSRGAPP
jgi:hypothetical protein